MATLEQHRQSIVTAVEAAKVTFTAYPLVIEYDNRMLIDHATQVNPYLCVEIKFLGGAQADLSTNPLHRKIGQIHLQAVVKEGDGTAKAYQLLDHFAPLLQRQNLGAIRTQMTTYVREARQKGWVYYPAIVPFWTHDVT
jgi:hypothetical protein